MPLQDARTLRQASEQGMPLAGRRARDLEHADLRPGCRLDHAAQRIGQQLVAETDAQIRHRPVDHGLADRRLLGDQPGMLGLLPDVHRPAHHPERIEGGEIRDRRAEIEPDRMPGDAVLAQQVAENAGIAGRHVLEHQDAWLMRRHRHFSKCGSEVAADARV